MSSDSAPSPDNSSPPSPDSSSSSPSPEESPKESSPTKPPSSPPPSSPPPSSPPPSSPPPSSPPPSSPPPPKDSSPPPKSSSSPPPPKGASSSPPPPKEATPASSQPPPKEPQAVPTPPAAVTGENDTAAATTPPHARPKTSPTGALSPPSHASSTPSTDSSDEDSSSSTDNKGKIAGVAIGASLVIIVLLVVCVVCIRRKRRKRREMQYYGDPADHHKGGGGYYNNTQQQNWHDMNNPQGDHVVRLNNQAPGGAAWPSGLPPISSEVTTNFSGAPLPPPSPTMSLGFNKSTFTYDELAAATNGFSEANLLGQGGFGYVHKGVLPNGKEVAVKSLKSGSGQGEREFAAEVEIISRVHHRHLVSLVGYCIAGGQRMLVYEFVENKTMEYHLHGKGLPPMDWPTRLRIAVGSAKGLAYLHEDCHPKIIHRDIKSANILLDFNFEAMVADFGLAKLSSDNYTHVSTRVMGTFGYLAPEYASSGKLSEKSDVFSFGVMLLELITGKRPVDPSNAMDDSLVDWARPLLNRSLEEGNNLELVDIRLDNNFNLQEMARMVACAAASIRHSARKRPKMSQIVRALEGDVSLDDLNEGTKPGQSAVFNPTSGGSSDYDTQAYNADMKKFRKLALSSQEFGSSEFGTSSNDSREMSGTPKNPKQQLP